MKKVSKIRSFTDLRAWQEAHTLVIAVYRLVKKFPSDERFCLTDQMKRSSLSVSSNIAEGFSRFTKPDKKYFYYLALGSLTELQNQLVVARGVGYFQNMDFQTFVKQTIEVSKLSNALIKYISIHT